MTIPDKYNSKKGLDADGPHFRLLNTLSLTSSSCNVKTNFESNQYSVNRKLRYLLADTGEEISIVHFENGSPFTTMELKNQCIGQDANVNVQILYRS